MDIITSIDYKAASIKGGATDKILFINLSENNISIIDLPEDYKDRYIGGRGYGLKLLWDYTDENTTYDSDENLLVMAGGPLCNEPRFPGAGKFVVGTISPATGTFIDSNVGGFFAPILKACGFDALAVQGIANENVVIVIDDDHGHIQIAKAPEFSQQINEGGISYGETLLEKYTGGYHHKNIAAVSTGIGAENTVFGLINSHFYDANRKRMRTKQAGRGGTGTVMRYKNLMGVIVHSSESRAKGNNPHDVDAVKKAGGTLQRLIKEEDPKQLNLASWGTPVLVEYMNRFHLLPINNFQQGQDQRAKTVFSDVFLEKFLKKKRFDGCYFGCNLACAKGAEDVVLTRGPFKGKTVGIDGPEYETAGAVTALGIFDPQFVMEFNWYCDEYGVDTISMGVSAAFLMECFQRGFLTKEDVGYDLTWGNMDSVDRLVTETAHGQGIGKVCGRGISYGKEWVADKYSERTGESKETALEQISKFAMETKGLEFSMYISRESLAQQGGYGMALKGPQHDEAWLIFLDQVHKEMETYEMKTAALKWFPLVRTWFNAVGLCKLPWIDVRHPEAAGTENPAQNMPTFQLYVDYLNATTGTDKSVADILHDSERLHLLQKLLNLRQGKGTRESDSIPLRAMAPAFIDEFHQREEYYMEWLKNHIGEDAIIPESPEKCHELLVDIRKESYEELLYAVYKAKGYDENGIPTQKTIESHELFDEKAEKLISKFAAGIA